jgi:uncharacterized membrane protein
MMLLVSFLYPFVLFGTFAYLGLELKDMLALKVLPLFMSLYVTFMMLLSHFKNDSFIVKIAVKFSKKPLDDREIAYIQKSTLFWIGVSLLNVVIHVIVLLHVNEYYWVVYSSFGWYIIFGVGGVLQYLHRKFIFLKVQDA